MHPPPSAAIWPLAWKEGMNNERCLHSAHSPPPPQRPQARRRGQRYVKYIGPCSPRRLTATSPTRDAADGRQRRPTGPPADVPLQVAGKSETGRHFCPAVTQPRPPLRCFHLRSHWSFPLLAPVATLFLPVFRFTGPPACARSAFSGPLSSSPHSPPPAGSFHLPSPLSVSLSFLFVTHPPPLCLPLLLVI